MYNTLLKNGPQVTTYVERKEPESPKEGNQATIHITHAKAT
jgi:hypothetical protein